MSKTLKKIFDDTITNTITWAKTLFDWKLEENVIETIYSESIRDYNKDLADKVKNIDDTTRRILNKIISEGQESGMNLNDIVDKIVENVEGMAKWRARRIALTETNTAVNNTDYKLAVESGIKTKTWVHVGSGFTDRPEHVVLDGKTIGIKEKFNVNGTMALNPMADNLPLGDKVNCGCLVIYD